MMDDPPALGLRHATLSVAAYDARWAALYAQEVARVRAALPGLAFEMAHIGSTSVPGLAAKPILDIAMRSEAEAEIAAALVGLGYIDRGYRSGRLFIRLEAGDVRTHNLHLYRPDEGDWAEQIAFRDALRADAGLRDAYAALKHALVAELGDAGRKAYTERKTAFVRAVVAGRRG